MAAPWPLPLHPRLAHMVLLAGRDAAPMAAHPVRRRRAARRAGGPVLAAGGAARCQGVHRRATPMTCTAPRWSARATRCGASSGRAGDSAGLGPAEMAALAYPTASGCAARASPALHAVGRQGRGSARRRPAGANPPAGRDRHRWRPARGAHSPGDPDCRKRLRGLYGDRFRWERVCDWSKRERKIIARERECFGALVLAERHWRDPDEAR